MKIQKEKVKLFKNKFKITPKGMSVLVSILMNRVYFNIRFKNKAFLMIGPDGQKKEAASDLIFSLTNNDLIKLHSSKKYYILTSQGFDLAKSFMERCEAKVYPSPKKE